MEKESIKRFLIDRVVAPAFNNAFDQVEQAGEDVEQMKKVARQLLEIYQHSAYLGTLFATIFLTKFVELTAKVYSKKRRELKKTLRLDQAAHPKEALHD